MRRGTRNLLIAVLAGSLALTACGGEGDSALTDPAETGEPDGATTTAAVDEVPNTAPGDYEPIEDSDRDDEFDAVVFDTFYNLMAAADIYRINPDDEASFIEDVGSAQVIEELDRQRASDLATTTFVPVEMESLLDSPDISVVDDQVVVDDCVKQTLLGENGNEIVKFVDMTVTMRKFDGSLWAESLTVNHPGGALEGIGCAPVSDERNAMEVAEQFYEALRPAQADPSNGLTPALAGLLSESAAEEMSQSLATLAADGQTVAQEGAEVSYRPLGRDGDVIGDNVVVEMCNTFVNGLQLVSGADRTDVFEPGESKATNLTVWSNGGDWKVINVSGFTEGDCE